MANNVSDTFVVYAALFGFAGLVAAFTVGASVIPVFVAIYFMLVATNAIDRGEKKANKRKK